jgi:hypothetical protein
MMRCDTDRTASPRQRTRLSAPCTRSTSTRQPESVRAGARSVSNYQLVFVCLSAGPSSIHDIPADRCPISGPPKPRLSTAARQSGNEPPELCGTAHGWTRHRERSVPACLPSARGVEATLTPPGRLPLATVPRPPQSACPGNTPGPSDSDSHPLSDVKLVGVTTRTVDSHDHESTEPSKTQLASIGNTDHLLSGLLHGGN